MAEQEKAPTPPAAEAGSAASLLDELVESARIKPNDEAYPIARQGLQAFIQHLLEPANAV